MMQKIKYPSVAGLFYPDDANELRHMVQQLIAEVKTPQAKAPKAIIAPHAGYVYSGAVAASAYACLSNTDHINKVVLLGPAHRYALQGMAISGAKHFQTPLGDILVDKSLRKKAIVCPSLTENDAAFKDEHSLEVHLPFLQTVLKDFTILPILVGRCATEQVAGLLDLLWGGGDTLIVVSSDLSHYLSYDEALAIDTRTSKAIVDLAPDAIQDEQACGRIPVKGLLTIAKRFGMHAKLIDQRNSGDTAGTKDKVVGYGAYHID